MTIAFTRGSTIYDDSRATKEILALLESGYKVKVFGWDRNGKACNECKQLFSNYKNNILFYFYNGNTGKKTINKIICRLKWSKWLMHELFANNDIDIIHACDFDTGEAVRKVAKKTNKKYIYDIFDYYVDSHAIPQFMKNYIEKKEISTINQSELTIICTEERREQINKSNPNKILVLHNSPDVERLDVEEEIFDYAYCGSMYGGRLLSEILDKYPQYNQLRFLFAGYGDYENKAKLLNEQFDNFTYLGSIQYSKVLEYENRSKIISAIYDPSIRNHRLCAPNKFYEALALAKPVIVCKGTGIDKIVKDNNIGIVIDYDAEQFYEAIEYLLNNPKVRKDMGINARKIYESKYRWSIMKNKLIKAYSEISPNKVG